MKKRKYRSRKTVDCHGNVRWYLITKKKYRTPILHRSSGQIFNKCGNNKSTTYWYLWGSLIKRKIENNSNILLIERFFNGVHHCYYGPAIETNLTKRYYIHGKNEHPSFPSIVKVDGSKVWFTNKNRPNLPVKILDNGIIEWRTANYVLDRTNGPAVTDIMGEMEFWTNGVELDRFTYSLNEKD